MAVRCDYHGFEAMRLHLLLKVLRDILDDRLNALRRFQEGGHLGGFLA